MPSRVLHLICLNDASVRSMRDTGLVKGETSSNRQAIIRVLEKKIEVVGEDGKVKKIPAFYLKEPPDTALFEEDEFDSRFLKGDDGEWKRPSDAWLAMRAKRIEDSEENKREVERAAREMLERDAAGSIAELLQMGRNARPAPSRPSRQRRGEEGGGEG